MSYLEWRARAVVPAPPTTFPSFDLEDTLRSMGELGDAVERYLARADTPHQSTSFANWDIPSMMRLDADWTKMVEMQLAKIRAINALGGPRMMIVWSGTCRHLGRIPRYPQDSHHILDAEAAVQEFLRQADEKGKVMCLNADGVREPRVLCLSMFSHRWERPNSDPEASFPDSASNKKARALAYYGESGLCPVFHDHRFDYYFWVDYAGINQEYYPEKLLGIAKLPGYISCAIEMVYYNSSSVDYENRAWTRLERVLGFAYSWSPLFVYMDDQYPQAPCDLRALADKEPHLYSIDASSGSLLMTVMNPLDDKAGVSDWRDRAYIGKLLDIVSKTRTLNPAFKGGGKLELGKSVMLVDTLHGAMDAEARRESAVRLIDSDLVTIVEQDAQTRHLRDGDVDCDLRDYGTAPVVRDEDSDAREGDDDGNGGARDGLMGLQESLLKKETSDRRVKVSAKYASSSLKKTLTDDYLALLRLSPRTPAEQRVYQAGSGWLAVLTTWINVTKCFVGAASFELPRAFSDAGTVGAIVGVCLLAVLSSFSLRRLAHCCELMPRNLASRSGSPFTYYQIGQEAFGRFGAATALFGVVAMTLGVCGSYIVFVCTTMAEVTGMRREVWLVLTMAAIVPLSWMRHLRIVAITSFFGIVALLTAVISVTLDAAEQQPPQPIGNMTKFDPEHYPMFLGNAGFLYLISTAVLPLYQDMDVQSAPHFAATFNSSIVFVTLLNLAFGLFAWYAYGSCSSDSDVRCVDGNVIGNLSVGPVKTAVQLLLSVDLLFTTIVFLYPFNEALERQLLKPQHGGTGGGGGAAGGDGGEGMVSGGESGEGEGEGEEMGRVCVAFSSWHEWKRNLLRTAVVCVVGFVAYLVPSFSLLTGLTGGFGNNILGFILPPLFYWRLQAKRGYWAHGSLRKGAEQACLVCIFLFGLGFLYLSTSSFVVAIAKQRQAR